MKQLFFSILYFCGALAAHCQSDTLQQKTKTPKRDLVNLKVDFTNVVNPEDPSMLFSIEYFVSNDLSLNHEAGYVVAVYSEGEHLGESFSGFKTRHELRWFFSDNQDNSTRVYTSLNFQYRYLAIEDRYTLGFECDRPGNCEYLKNFIGAVETDRYVVQLRLGVQSHLSERLILECDAGIGHQNYLLRRSSVNGGRFMEPNRFFTEESFGTRPYISISGKLGFVLFKR